MDTGDKVAYEKVGRINWKNSTDLAVSQCFDIERNMNIIDRSMYTHQVTCKNMEAKQKKIQKNLQTDVTINMLIQIQ